MVDTPASNFVWHELRTTDTDAAEAFYCAVLGCTAQHMDVEGKPYTCLAVGDTTVAGVMTLPAEAREAGAPIGWVGYVGVADVDAMVPRLLDAGGTLYHPAMDIPAIGRFASVADPQTAIFALFQPQPGSERTPPPPGTPGTVGWNELHAADWTAAFALYSGLFGWQKDRAVDMGPMGTYQLFSTGADAVGGMMTRMDPARRPGWLYYFNVDGLDAAIARIATAGGAVVNGPHEVPGGSWIIQGTDPQGGPFALVSPVR